MTFYSSSSDAIWPDGKCFVHLGVEFFPLRLINEVHTEFYLRGMEKKYKN